MQTTLEQFRHNLLGHHIIPDSKVHGANTGPIWGRQDPGGPHVGPMNFAIWDVYKDILIPAHMSLARFYHELVC